MSLSVIRPIRKYFMSEPCWKFGRNWIHDRTASLHSKDDAKGEVNMSKDHKFRIAPLT